MRLALTQSWMCLLTLLHLVGGAGRPRRPPRRPGGGPRPGFGGGLSGIIGGLQFNLLDLKLLGLGYVRQELVQELCSRASQQLVREGISRARTESNVLVRNISQTIDNKCESLVNEGQRACDNVLGQIMDRFSSLNQEAMKEGEKQCQETKKVTVQMVKRAAETTYNSTLGLGRQVAENEFLKQVEQQKNRGERMFQEQIEKGREEAEKELRKRISEGRQMAESNFTRLVSEGKKEAEMKYQQTIVEEREKAEEFLQETIAKEVAKAETVFQDRVAKGRAEAEKIFKEQSRIGSDEGERMCTEMISVACQNVTAESNSEEFCEEFFFFTGDLDDDFKRLKRQPKSLYGGFYNEVV